MSWNSRERVRIVVFFFALIGALVDAADIADCVRRGVCSPGFMDPHDGGTLAGFVMGIPLIIMPITFIGTVGYLIIGRLIEYAKGRFSR